MSNKLAVAALLLMALDDAAQAAESSAHTLPDAPGQRVSKKAEKIILCLEKLDISTPGMRNAVYELDERIEDGYLRLAQTEVGGGKLTFRYDLGSPRLHRLELHYASPDSGWEYRASSREMMVHYRLNY